MNKKVFINPNQTSKFPYFYVIRHIETNKLYAGFHCRKNICDSSKLMTECGYQTSSKIIKGIIAKCGVSSFEVLRIRHFNTSNEALKYESKFLLKVNAKSNARFLNISNGDGKFSTVGISFPLSKKSRQKLSETNRGRKWWNNGVKSKWQKECPGEGWVGGRLCVTDETREKIKQSLQGYAWWNNGIINTYCAAPPDSSWISGRLYFKRENQRKGYTWWNNGIESTNSYECPGDGWVRGRLFSEDGLRNMSESKVGKVHWNNGIKTITSIECPGEGWVRGLLQTDTQKENRRATRQNRVHWNNGIKTITSIECPGEGWVKGSLHRGKKKWWNNGIIEKTFIEQPSGEWVRGRLKN